MTFCVTVDYRVSYKFRMKYDCGRRLAHRCGDDAKFDVACSPRIRRSQNLLLVAVFLARKYYCCYCHCCYWCDRKQK